VVHSDAKGGRDAGDLCGIDAVGVAAPRIPPPCSPVDADVVVYAAAANLRRRRPSEDQGAPRANTTHVLARRRWTPCRRRLQRPQCSRRRPYTTTSGVTGEHWRRILGGGHADRVDAAQVARVPSALGIAVHHQVGQFEFRVVG